MGGTGEGERNLQDVEREGEWVRDIEREPLGPDATAKPEYPEVEGYSYGVNVDEKRAFEPKMYWYPIPESEIMQTGWDQNVNW